MQVVFLKQAEREMKGLPEEVRINLRWHFLDLRAGRNLTFPISRPLFSIKRGLSELRMSNRAGEFRVFYLIVPDDAIYVVHAMQKKTQELENVTNNLIKQRIRSFIE